MATEPINIPIKTTYDDDGAKEALKDAEKLDQAEPEIEVTADAKGAIDDLDKVEGIAQDLLDRNPWVAEILADTDAAKTDLEGLQAKLKETGDVATTEGGKVGKASKGAAGEIAKVGSEADQSKSVLANMVGNSASEIGELGGIAGTAGQAIGQLGEYATEGNISLAGLAKVAGPMAALSVATLAVAQGAKQAAAANKRLTESIDDLSTASDEAALASVTDMMVDQFVAGKDLAGVWDRIAEGNIEGARRLHDLMLEQGLSETQTKGLRDAIEKLDTAAINGDATAEKYGKRWGEVSTAQADAKTKADDLKDALDDLAGALDIERAAQDFDTNINQAMANTLMGVGNTRDEIRGIEDDVLAAGQYTKQNPIVVAQTLEKVKQGDLQGAKADVDAWYAEHPAQMTVVVNQQKLKQQITAAQGGLQSWIDRLVPGGTSAPAGRASTQVVNVNLPRGARHGDIARAMNLSTRRNGRRYGNPSGTVAYARRG
jgi:hypothetical protein